jgi:hypothetical protein
VLHDGPRALVEEGQPIERRIERQHIGTEGRTVTELLPVQGGADEIAAALVGAALAGVVNQDLPHRTRGDCHEMRAVHSHDPRGVGELHVCLVHEGGRVERVSWTLTAQLPRGDLPELIVEPRHGPIERRTIASSQLREQPRQLGHAGVGIGHGRASRSAACPVLRAVVASPSEDDFHISIAAGGSR